MTSSLPNQQQTWLLRAALLQGDECREALENWSSAVDLMQVDSPSQRLIPLLYHNLHAQNFEHHNMNRLKGTHRYWWINNNRQFRHLKTLIAELEDRGINRLALLKGTALLNDSYPNFGLRAMADSDILVPIEDASAALQAMLDLGFIPGDDLNGQTRTHWIKYCISFKHGSHFHHPELGEIDLHWRCLNEQGSLTADRRLWDNIVESDIDSQAVKLPSRADLLLHIIVHGLRWNQMPAIWWVADAVTLLRQTTDLDRSYLNEQARLTGDQAILNRGLNWLHTHISSEIACAEASGWYGDRQWRRHIHPPQRDGLTSAARRFTSDFYNYRESCGFAGESTSFKSYLKLRWNLNSSGEIPKRAFTALQNFQQRNRMTLESESVSSKLHL